MNLRILTSILFLLVLVPVMSTITAQEDTSISNVREQTVYLIEDNPKFYAFVQIIHRDSDGNLLAFIESDKVSTFDTTTLYELINYDISHGTDPVY